jgi:hypothetical protein
MSEIEKRNILSQVALGNIPVEIVRGEVRNLEGSLRKNGVTREKSVGGRETKVLEGNFQA